MECSRITFVCISSNILHSTLSQRLHSLILLSWRFYLCVGTMFIITTPCLSAVKRRLSTKGVELKLVRRGGRLNFACAKTFFWIFVKDFVPSTFGFFNIWLAGLQWLQEADGSGLVRAAQRLVINLGNHRFHFPFNFFSLFIHSIYLMNNCIHIFLLL